MDITIENNKVIVNLDETEFPVFEAMFANLENGKNVECEFRDFNGLSGTARVNLLPMHLCRTIGEANLAADPFATVSLYPFWKYGFAFGVGEELALNPGQEDPHKKAVAADEMGMGSAWPTANGFGQKILPRKGDCSGPSQASILSAGFSWKDSSTTERIP